jgi:hypothetical protein
MKFSSKLLLNYYAGLKNRRGRGCLELIAAEETVIK